MTKDSAKKALVLFAHGARNPEWASSFRRVQQLAQDRLPEVSVELAFLEFMQPDLPAAVRLLAQRGCDEVTVKPLFFGSSGHVLRDLPGMVAQLQAEYPAMSFRVAQAVGEDAGVLAAVAQACVAELGA
jgi:sirohydrochlorin cobaltochelatase